jgi:N-acetylglutamate synthase/N-acetylornithine aminotransferase
LLGRIGVELVVDFKADWHDAMAVTSDLSHDSVKINAKYRI